MTRQDPASQIRDGKLPEKPFPVCVEPDLVGEYEELVKLRDAAKEVGSTPVAGSATAELDEQIAAVQKRMEAATVVLRLRALSRRRWKELKDQHPARKEKDGTVVVEDILTQVNTATFFEPLIKRSIVEPELDEETVGILLEEKLTDGQWEHLTTVVWNLNESRISIPFSSAASTSRRNTSRR